MRALAAIGCLALAATPLAAQVVPTPGTGDPRVQTVTYQPDQIVQLQAAPGYQLTLEFAPDEQIENVAIGDSGAWQATPNRHGDRLFLKPLGYGTATNMTVVTSVRVYLFDLVPLGGPSSEMAYRVRFDYPSAAQAQVEETPVATEEGRYRLSGNRSLRPSRISDDGLHTYIEWAADRSIPAVFAIDARGQESLVNGMMRDGIFVIDSVSGQLVFRIDDHVARATRRAPRASD